MLNSHDYLALLAPLASDEVAEQHFGKEPCVVCKGEAADHGGCPGYIPTLAGLEQHCQIVADYIEETNCTDPRIGVIREMELSQPDIEKTRQMGMTVMVARQLANWPLLARLEYRRRVWEMLAEKCPQCKGMKAFDNWTPINGDGVAPFEYRRNQCSTCHGFGFVGTEAKWCDRCDRRGEVAAPQAHYTISDNVAHFHNQGGDTATIRGSRASTDLFKLRPGETMLVRLIDPNEFYCWSECPHCAGQGWVIQHSLEWHRQDHRRAIGEMVEPYYRAGVRQAVRKAKEKK